MISQIAVEWRRCNIKNEKHGVMDKIKGGLKHVSQAVSSIVFPQIAAGAEIIMKKLMIR